MSRRVSAAPIPPSAAPAAEDARDARALSPAENADLCAGCVRCCTYVSIEIDPPRSAWEYDQWIWVLHHRGLQIYLERPERWFLHVEGVCRQLNAAGRCDIHGRHPVLCRDYDPRTCERRYPLSDIRAWFREAADLEAWMQRERPAHWRRLVAWRRDAPQAPPVADALAARAPAGFVPVESLAVSAAGARRPAGRPGREALPRRSAASTRRASAGRRAG
uniref:YkgJ family cysteine cluster protein n=1 Tax=Eiseniibacteriota bacterium TaxID=2212470 RepID=A0A832MJH5_UNCEI